MSVDFPVVPSSIHNKESEVYELCERPLRTSNVTSVAAIHKTSNVNVLGFAKDEQYLASAHVTPEYRMNAEANCLPT